MPLGEIPGQEPSLHGKKVPRWEIIAGALQTQIETGVIEVGNSLPPQTTLAEQFGVKSTRPVIRAFADLTEKGLVAQERQGPAVVINDTPPSEKDQPKKLSVSEIVYDLSRRIQDEEYPTGSNLPKQKELARKYGVSLGSIERVIKQLRVDGYTTSKGSGGTRVARTSPVEKPLEKPPVQKARHLIIAGELSKRIKSGEFSMDDMPKQAALMTQYDCSLTTIQRAFRTLRAQRESVAPRQETNVSETVVYRESDVVPEGLPKLSENNALLVAQITIPRLKLIYPELPPEVIERVSITVAGSLATDGSFPVTGIDDTARRILDYARTLQGIEGDTVALAIKHFAAVSEKETLQDFPDEPTEILALARELWKKKVEVRGGGKLRNSVSKKSEQLLEQYKAIHKTTLTPAQEKALKPFTRILVKHSMQIESSSDLYDVFAKTAPLFLAEFDELQTMIPPGQIGTIIMRHSLTEVQKLFTDFQTNKLVAHSDILWALRKSLDPHTKLNDFMETIKRLSGEPGGLERKSLTALKTAAQSKDPDNTIGLIGDGMIEGRRKYLGNRFITPGIVNSYCAQYPYLWETKIKDHIKRCAEIAPRFHNDEEVSDSIIRNLARRRSDPDKLLHDIKDYKRYFGEAWAILRVNENLDKETLITIAENSHPTTIEKNANIWLSRYHWILETFEDIAEPYILKDFLARNIYTKNRVIRPKLESYAAFLKVSIFTTDPQSERPLIETEKPKQLYPPQQTVEDPDILNLKKAKIINALGQLSYEEQQAVQLAYGLEWLTGDDNLMHPSELETFFGTENLTEYVKTVIIPKIRP